MPVMDQVAQVCAQIKTELESVERALGGGGTDAVELDQTRVGRLSRMDALQQQALAAGMRERLLQRRRRLEAALARLDAGTYGACCQCGDAIAIERLQADPGAPFCASCQEDIDESRRS